MIPITGNTYPIKDQLKAMGGRWDAAAKCWMVPDAVAATAKALVPAPRQASPKAAVGDLSGIMALFATARRHLKFPAVVLSVPANGTAVRISVAGERAREPGSLTLCTADRNGEGERDWLGRISLDGTFQPSRDLRDPAILTERLRQFACHPAEVAAEHGRLTGRCCFCNRALTDERSTAVGYGETCAGNYGLPWGARPAAFARAAA